MSLICLPEIESNAEFMTFNLTKDMDYRKYIEQVVTKKLHEKTAQGLYWWPAGILWLKPDKVEAFTKKLIEVQATYPKVEYLYVISPTRYEFKDKNEYLLCPHCLSSDIDDDSPVWHCNKCEGAITSMSLKNHQKG